jgi:PleD family two-component response regulator
LFETLAAEREKPQGLVWAGNQFAGGRTQMRVLIADDAEMSAGMLAVVLEVYGHEVRQTSSAGFISKSAREFEPHLVLLAVTGRVTSNQLETVEKMRAAADGDIQIFAICAQPNSLLIEEHKIFDSVFPRPVRFGQIKPFLDAPVRELPVAS